MLSCLFLFFKLKTAYDLRISDWSSDVCSSDLHRQLPHDLRQLAIAGHGKCEPHLMRSGHLGLVHIVIIRAVKRVDFLQRLKAPDDIIRSEERRVGKVCVSKCRCRWSM